VRNQSDCSNRICKKSINVLFYTMAVGERVQIRRTGRVRKQTSFFDDFVTDFTCKKVCCFKSVQ